MAQNAKPVVTRTSKTNADGDSSSQHRVARSSANGIKGTDDHAAAGSIHEESDMEESPAATPPRNLPETQVMGAEILTKPPFVINVGQWADGHVASVMALHSKSLPQNMTSMTLAGFRRRIPSMSTDTTLHKFCTLSGVTITDETLTLGDYLHMETLQGAVDHPESATPSVQVFFKVDSPNNQPEVEPAKPSLMQKLRQSAQDSAYSPRDEYKANTDLDPNKLSGGKEATAFTERSRSELISGDLSVAGGSDVGKSAGYITEANWEEVLRNCGIMYGWVVNRETNAITRAPKAAFKLRAITQASPVGLSIPDFIQTSTTTNTPKPTPAPQAIALESLSAKDEKWSSVGKGNDPDLMLNELDREDSHPDNSRPQPVLTSKSSGKAVVKQKKAAPPTSKKLDPDSGSGVEQDSTDQDQANATPSDPSETNTDDAGQVAPKATNVMPAFQVNDNSRIDVTACEHEFEVSMARNDFSSQSTSASLSGGYAGFSVAVSAGYSNSESTSSKTTFNQLQKTLVAKYLFPRADIYIDPEDVEPTEELKQLLVLIGREKNINDLRRLNKEFGQLFCQQVTVGGRLLSTKVTTSMTRESEEESKSQFKISVGLDVQTPIGVGAGLKHDEEKGSGQSTNTTDTTQNESNVFEAVGGDTILASSPAAWATSVGDYRTWRIIDRDGLIPLSTIISAIPGYAQVRDYFVQAVPALSKFIQLSDGRQVKARLRLTSPSHGLSLWQSNNPAYYLGHRPGKPATPYLMYLQGTDVNSAWGNMNDPNPSASKEPLFRPGSWQAPVIQGYQDNIVGSHAYGVDYNQEFVNTIWSICSPFTDSLQHGARVILRTVPLSRTAPSPPTYSLVVFRNQQGLFLPAMSDIEDYQYWRILKSGGSFPGENIKEGDEITLCWAFADQTVGFRDYTDDVFGRRRNQCPADLESEVLYLKMPWPRFESLQNQEPTSMAMWPVADSTPVGAYINCVSQTNPRGALETHPFLMEEVKFRIDTVANDGKGDTDDYMLKGVNENSTRDIQQEQLALLYRMFFL